MLSLLNVEFLTEFPFSAQNTIKRDLYNCFSLTFRDLYTQIFELPL